jgi:hypothetical protein
MEEPKFKNIEKGTHPVTCIAVRPDVLENPQYGDGSVIKFKLEFDGMEEDDGEPVTREAMAGDYLTPGSKLTRYLFAFGISAGIGEEVEIEDAVGRQALAVVGQKTKGEKVYDTIENLIPAPKTALRRATAKTEQIAPEDVPWDGDIASVINPDGGCNWARFWMEAGKHGINEQHVIAFAGDGYAAYDGADAQQMLEALIAKANA